MFKKVLFALIPACLIATSAFAGDDLMTELASADLSAISDAQIDIETFDLAGVNVDALSNEAGSENAIEACFRSFGYCGGFRGYHGGFYGNCYNPCFNYINTYSYCYPTYYCYRPLYTCALPVVYSYWGCY